MYYNVHPQCLGFDPIELSYCLAAGERPDDGGIFGEKASPGKHHWRQREEEVKSLHPAEIEDGKRVRVDLFVIRIEISNIHLAIQNMHSYVQRWLFLLCIHKICELVPSLVDWRRAVLLPRDNIQLGEGALPSDVENQLDKVLFPKPHC